MEVTTRIGSIQSGSRKLWYVQVFVDGIRLDPREAWDLAGAVTFKTKKAASAAAVAIDPGDAIRASGPAYVTVMSASKNRSGWMVASRNGPIIAHRRLNAATAEEARAAAAAMFPHRIVVMPDDDPKPWKVAA